MFHFQGAVPESRPFENAAGGRGWYMFEGNLEFSNRKYIRIDSNGGFLSLRFGSLPFRVDLAKIMIFHPRFP